MVAIVDNFCKFASLTYREVKEDFSRLKTGIDQRLEDRSKLKVRSLAAAKFAARAGVFAAGVFAIGAVSTLLSGAILLGSVKVAVAALAIILSRDILSAFRSERISNIYRSKNPKSFKNESTPKERQMNIVAEFLKQTWTIAIIRKIVSFIPKSASRAKA